jgi:hypothetical protein
MVYKSRCKKVWGIDITQGRFIQLKNRKRPKNGVFGSGLHKKTAPAEADTV